MKVCGNFYEPRSLVFIPSGATQAIIATSLNSSANLLVLIPDVTCRYAT